MFKEWRLVHAFLRRAPGSLEALVNYYTNQSRAFMRIGPRYYTSCFGLVRVCADIYGYEVKLGNPFTAELLDSCPAYYGLTKPQADKLFTATISNVPGSTCYAEKQKTQGRMLSNV